MSTMIIPSSAEIEFHMIVGSTIIFLTHIVVEHLPLTVLIIVESQQYLNNKNI